MLLSIIIPVYNIAAYIDRCVESIVDQEYRQIEIILVDDGSMDGSGDICDRWLERDERIIVIHKVNGGVSSTRNAGLSAAKGDYIAFVDGDDFISPCMYSKLMKIVETKDVDIAACSYYTGNDGNWKPGIGVGVEFSGDRTEAVRKCLEMRDVFPSVCLAVYSKRALEGLRFRGDLRISEDRLFNYQAISRCQSYYHIGDCLYYYCQRESSALHRKEENNTDSLRAQDLIYEDVKRNFPQLLAYAERISIVERIVLLNANAKQEKWEKCDEIAASLTKYKDTYMRNPYLKKTLKILVWCSFVNRKVSYFLILMAFKMKGNL